MSPTTIEYLVVNSRLTWDEHNSGAHSAGRNLVSIHSLSDNSFLKNLVDEHFNSCGGGFWLGGRRKGANSEVWEWNDGTNFGYSNWGSGEPNNTYENRIELGDTGTWNDIGQDQTRCAIYMKAPSIEYLVVTSRLTWDKHSSNAQSLGRNLVSIHSASDNGFFMSLAHPHFNGCVAFWLGGTRIGTDEPWNWIDGTNFVYTNWGNGEPSSDSDNENRIEMSSTGNWNDIRQGETRCAVYKKAYAM